MKTKSNVAWVFAAVGGVCLGAAAVGMSQQAGVAPIQLAPPPARAPEDLSIAFREVAARTLPAVVSIATETRPREIAQGDRRGISGIEEQMLRQFFGEQSPQFREHFNSPRMTPRQEGAGSGFIVDASGIILTNSHVVQGADRVKVILYDGRELNAESWVTDPRSDVAIVRVKTDEDLPTIPIGDSDHMQIGDWVLALGNPFNVGTTVTAGIVSATGRGPGINERESFLQTDAAINPGNSGGPLVNLYGEVVGINTAISSRSGGYDGIGFAIPANYGRWVANQLIESGSVSRSYLGVALAHVSPDLREQLQVPFGQGTLVREVLPNTPAAKAKLQPADVIIEFDGTKIAESETLIDLVERSEPGKSYPVVLLRDGKSLAVQVKLEKMPSDYTPALRGAQNSQADRPSASEDEQVTKLGLKVSELTEDVRTQLELDSDAQGLAVIGVQPGSPAFRGGLKVGDVIQKVGSSEVNSVQQLGELIKAGDLSRGLLVHVKRGESLALAILKIDN